MGDEANTEALNKAVEKQQELKNKIAGTTEALKQNQQMQYMDRYRQELRADHGQCWAEEALAAAGKAVEGLDERELICLRHNKKLPVKAAGKRRKASGTAISNRRRTRHKK